MKNIFFKGFTMRIVLGISGIFAVVHLWGAITVTNTNDAGAGSLRAAITTANGAPDTIVFDASIAGQTITITGDSLVITNTYTIDGESNNITISGGGSRRPFIVQSGGPTLANLTLDSGKALGGAGGNTRSGGGGGGGAGLGGAVFSDSTNVTLTNIIFSNNNATGGVGGSSPGSNLVGGGGGGGLGGNAGASSSVDGELGGGGGGGQLTSQTGTNGTTTGGAGGGSGGAGGNAHVNGTAGGRYGGGGGGGGFSGTDAAKGGNGGFGGGGGGEGDVNNASGVDLGGGVGGYGGGGGGVGQDSNGPPGGTTFGGGTGGTGSTIGNPGGGGAGLGGALFVSDQSTTTLTYTSSGAASSAFSSNSVTAGAAGSGNGSGTLPTAGQALGQDIFVAGGGTLTFNIDTGISLGVSSALASDTLSGASVTKTGAGTLTYSGASANTYTGTTTVSAGTLALNKTAGTNAIAGNVAVNGGTLSLSAANQIANTSVMTLGGGTFNMGGNAETLATLTFNSGTLTQGGATLTLADATTVLTMRDTTISGPLTFSGAGAVVFDNTNNGTATISGNINLGTNTTTFNIANGTASSDMSISGIISNGGLTKSGAGTLSLSGVNTYASGTTINAGTLALSGTGVVPTTSAVTLSGSGIFDISAASSPITIGDLASSSTSSTVALGSQSILLGTASSTEFQGVISGTGGLTKQNGGTLTLSGTSANTYTGTTTVSAGTLALNKTAGTNAIAGNVAVNGGTLSLSAANQIANTSVMTLGGGTFNMGGNAETLGSLTFNSGTLTQGGATLTLADATTVLTMRDTTISGPLAFSGAGSVVFDSTNNGTAAISGNIDLGTNTTTFNIADGSAATDMNLSGVISNGGLTKSGAGNLQLSGASANTYTGTTTVSAGTLALNKTAGTNAIAGNVAVNGGTLSLSAANQIANTSVMTLGGGTFNMGGNAETLATLTFNSGTLTQGGATLTLADATTVLTMRDTTISGPLAFSGAGAVVFDSTNNGTATISGNVDLGTNTTTFNIANGTASSDMSISGIISNGGLTKSGAGTLTLSGVNTYASGTTINAGTLALSGTGVVPTTSAVTLSGSGIFDISAASSPITIGDLASSSTSSTVALGSQSILLGTASTTEFQGVISGTGGLTKQGAGTLTLSGTSPNTYTGTTTMSLGTLVLNKTAGTNAIAGNIVVNAGTLSLSAANQIANTSAMTLSGGTFNMGGNAETLGSLTFNSGVLAQGGGILTLNDNTTLLTMKNLTISGPLAFAGTGAVVFDNSNNGTATISGNIDLGTNTTTFNIAEGTASTDMNLSGVMSNGGLTKLGAGTLQLSGASANTYTGVTTVTAGVLALNKTAGTNAIAGNISVNGGTLSLSAANQIANTSVMTLGGGTFNMGGNAETLGSLTFNSGTLTQGGGTLTLADGTTLLTMRDTTISGPLVFSGAGAVVFDSTNNGTAAISGNIDLGTNTTTFNVANGTASSDMNLSGEISNGGLTKTGAGTLELSGGSGNNYLGMTTVTAGTLILNKTAGTEAIAGDITINGGTLSLAAATQISNSSNMTIGGGTFNMGGNDDTINSLTFNSGTLTQGGAVLTLMDPTTCITMRNTTISGPIFLDGAGAIAFDNTSNGTATISGNIDLGTNTTTFNIANGLASSDMNVSGVISNGALIKAGAGVLTLSAPNTYNGGTTINAGTLALSGSGSVPTSTDVAISGSGIFDISGTTAGITIADLSSSSSSTGVNLGAQTLTLGTSGNATFAGVISGTGALAKQGSGIFTLEGVNTFTGGTTINQGTVAISAGGNLSSSSACTLNGTSILDISAATGTVTIGDLSSSSSNTSIVLGAKNLNMTINSDTTFAGNIQGTGSIQKQGSGIFTLTGTNTFSGTATASAGEIIVNGSTANATTIIESDGTLRGTGTLGQVLCSGTLIPGNSIGTITGATFQFLDGSNLEMEVNAEGLGDKVVGTTSVTINPGSTLTIVPVEGFYADRTRYELIFAPSVTGQFSTLVNTAPRYTLELQYFSDSVYLLLDNTPFIRLVSGGSNPNEQAVANYLDYLDRTLNVRPRTDLYDVFVLLACSTPDQLDYSFNHMQPAQYNGIMLAQEYAVLAFSSTLRGQLDQTRVTVCSPFDPSWRVWATPFGTFTHQRSYSYQTGYTSSLIGLSGGFEKDWYNPFGIDDKWQNEYTLGVGTGYSDTHVHWKDGYGKGNVSGPYASMHFRAGMTYLELQGIFTAAFPGYHVNRNVEVISECGNLQRDAEANYDGFDINGYVALVGNYPNRWVDISPLVSFDYLYTKQYSFIEQGAESLNLEVSKNIMDLYRLEGGVLFSRCFSDWFIPEVGFSVVQEWRNHGKHLTARFAGYPGSFEVTGMLPNRTLYVPKADITALFYKGKISTNLSYYGEFGHNFNDQTVALQFAIRF